MFHSIKEGGFDPELFVLFCLNLKIQYYTKKRNLLYVEAVFINSIFTNNSTFIQNRSSAINSRESSNIVPLQNLGFEKRTFRG